MLSKPDIYPYTEWNFFSDTRRPLIIAGPCSAESEFQLFQTAQELKNNGIDTLRAGLWKPRTRPNSFEGVGSKGLSWLKRVQEELNMKVSAEVANGHHVEMALSAGIDLLWIGARTTANPFAVQEIAEALKGVDIPVLIKNPINPDIELWIGAFERLNLCGLTRLGAIHRGFSSYNNLIYRNHIGGHSEYLQEIAQKSMDLGFDGLIIESHICPASALSDAEQQVTPQTLKHILSKLIIRTEQSLDSNCQLMIEELREKIDNLDNMVLETLANRMKIIEDIGQYKKQNNITILQPDRWEKILNRVTAEAKQLGLNRELVEKVFKAIHQASIDRQTEIMNE